MSNSPENSLKKSVPAHNEAFNQALISGAVAESPLKIENFSLVFRGSYPGEAEFPEILTDLLAQELKAEVTRPINLGSGVCASSHLVEINGVQAVLKIPSYEFYLGDIAETISSATGAPYNVLEGDLQVLNMRRGPGLPRLIGHIADERGVVVALAKEYVCGPTIAELVKAGSITRSQAEDLIQEYIDGRSQEGLWPVDIRDTDYLVTTVRGERQLLVCVDPSSNQPLDGLEERARFKVDQIKSVLIDGN